MIFKVGHKNRELLHEIFVLCQTDFFWFHREEFGAGFFTVELQKAIRAFVLRKEFYIVKIYDEEHYQLFIDANISLGKPLELFMNWLLRSVLDQWLYDIHGRICPWDGWFCFLERCVDWLENYKAEFLPQPIFDELMAQFGARFYVPNSAMKELEKQAEKYWLTLSDAVDEERDTGRFPRWAKGYDFECAWYVHGSSYMPHLCDAAKNNFFADFLDWYEDTITGDLKDLFYLEIANICEFPFMEIPSRWLTEPIEGLR